MKVVHISTFDDGGAGLAALRIHLSLRSLNVDSMMLVAHKNSSVPSVIEVEKSELNTVSFPKNRFLRRVKRWLHKRGMFQSEMECDEKVIKSIPTDCRAFFTTPISNYDLRSHPLIDSADLIHLHWIEGFVDYRTFFQSLNKPVIWTFHDENIGFGGFHYQREYDKYYNKYKLLEDKYTSLKKDAISLVKDITMISLSKEMDSFCHEKSFLKERTSYIIPNAVDFKRYCIHDKTFAKSVFKIPSDSIVITFCAYIIDEPRKGLSELLTSLESLNIPNLVLFCIGGGNLPRSTSLQVYRAGYVTNEDVLSLMYSASDLFVMPSYQEAFAQTPLEAMSCGVPTVAFPVSGTALLLNESNGVRCEEFSVQALVEGINKALQTPYNPVSIREDIITRFSPMVVAKQYLSVYHEVISHHNQ